MLIPFRRTRENTKPPTRAHQWDAGFDLYAAEIEIYPTTDQMVETILAGGVASIQKVMYKTGIAVSIPPGYAGLLMMRSSVRDTSLSLANAVGLIDPGFQGELVLSYRKLLVDGYMPKVGDKVGQLVIIERPAVILEEVDEFVIPSERGQKGHGSSGR